MKRRDGGGQLMRRNILNPVWRVDVDGNDDNDDDDDDDNSNDDDDDDSF